MCTTLEKRQPYLLQLLWSPKSLAQCSIFLEESDRDYIPISNKSSISEVLFMFLEESDTRL